MAHRYGKLQLSSPVAVAAFPACPALALRDAFAPREDGDRHSDSLLSEVVRVSWTS
jgi:hypothetical protein